MADAASVSHWRRIGQRLDLGRLALDAANADPIAALTHDEPYIQVEVLVLLSNVRMVSKEGVQMIDDRIAITPFQGVHRRVVVRVPVGLAGIGGDGATT